MGSQARDDASQTPRLRPRLIAFYLPQFHPIPENDFTWGKGFTEWANVVRAKPLFPGHYQPRIPADLGFYDLRLPEVRQAQADLAREHGIYGFCYYHYWTKGRRVLERPFDEMFESGHPDFPFCLCWANHNWQWSKVNGDQGRFIAQEYSEDDDREHIRWLLDVFRDERYITINGRPLLLIWRVQDMPDPVTTFTMWKEEARKNGVAEPYICKVESQGDFDNPHEYNCDAATEFWPHGARTLTERIRSPERVYRDNVILEYRSLVARHLERPMPPFQRFPCVVPQWDNTARYKPSGAQVLQGSTPELYGRWLEDVIEKTSSNQPEEQLIFMNAWNEWAEGAYLEPDFRYGRAYLEATRHALRTSGVEIPADVATEAPKAEGGMAAPPSTEQLYRRLQDKYTFLQQQLTERLAVEEQSPLLLKAEQRIEELERDHKQLRLQYRKLEERHKKLQKRHDRVRSKLERVTSSRQALSKPHTPRLEDRLLRLTSKFRSRLGKLMRIKRAR